MAKKSTPEGAVLRASLDWLTAQRILAFRMQVGGMSGENAGKRWFMRFGTPGMSDVLAFRQDKSIYDPQRITPCWLEMKAVDGKQSALQKSFQEQVESYGHVYAIIRSIEDLCEVFK